LKIFFDNVDFQSNSGPNSFGLKLASELEKNGCRINKDDSPDVQISFIQATRKIAPLVQRLDGIYFNSEQDWKAQNQPIQETYNNAEGVIYQSSFNKTLTEKYFGKKEKSVVIHNGTDFEKINKILPLENKVLDDFENVWTCASSWRPHKRLSENVRYFLEHSGENDCLVIAGSNPDYEISHNRIFYAGNLNWEQLISLYKKSSYFIHLALLDHCPNVVVDARAAGCKIICSSSGGTREIAGFNSVIIQDIKWDYLPFKLYDPPKLDFSKVVNCVHDVDIDIIGVSKKYEDFLKKVIKWA
jgi:glycosyltransferase involved in cell wall biosynthesis